MAMCSYKCKICEALTYGKGTREETTVFPDFQSLCNHVLKCPDPEHAFFRKRLKIPDLKDKTEVFRKFIEGEKHLWVRGKT